MKFLIIILLSASYAGLDKEDLAVMAKKQVVLNQWLVKMQPSISENATIDKMFYDETPAVQGIADFRLVFKSTKNNSLTVTNQSRLTAYQKPESNLEIPPWAVHLPPTCTNNHFYLTTIQDKKFFYLNYDNKQNDKSYQISCGLPNSTSKSMELANCLKLSRENCESWRRHLANNDFILKKLQKKDCETCKEVYAEELKRLRESVDIILGTRDEKELKAGTSALTQENLTIRLEPKFTMVKKMTKSFDLTEILGIEKQCDEFEQFTEQAAKVIAPEAVAPKLDAR